MAERKTLGMSVLKEHLISIVYSGLVKDEFPLSTLILAHPEHAKTTEVEKLRTIHAIIMNDLTAYGLTKLINDLTPEERKQFTHIVIPDLERVNARSITVRNEFLTTLQILMAEGIEKISTYYIHIDFPKRFKLGVIACTTPEDLGDRRSVLRKASFLSRLIPFSYDFSPDQKIRILDYIKKEEHLQKELSPIPKKKLMQVTIPEELKNKLDPYAVTLAQSVDRFTAKSIRKISKEGKRYYELDMQPKLIGSRAMEMFLCYLKSIALKNGRTVVAEKDFGEFRRLFNYFNFELKPLIEE